MLTAVCWILLSNSIRHHAPDAFVDIWKCSNSKRVHTRSKKKSNKTILMNSVFHSENFKSSLQKNCLFSAVPINNLFKLLSILFAIITSITFATYWLRWSKQWNRNISTVTIWWVWILSKFLQNIYCFGSSQRKSILVRAITIHRNVCSIAWRSNISSLNYLWMVKPNQNEKGKRSNDKTISVHWNSWISNRFDSFINFVCL